ncbi:MAG TPA: O-methyltransferase [Gemmatimonadaceae bacterium]
MTQELWTKVDEYIVDKLFAPDASLDGAVRASDDAGLPSIQVTAPQGRMIAMLARLQRAKRILEIGTLGGYSTIWLARELPDDGRLITMEVDPRHAGVARQNIERAGLSSKVDIRIGDARQLLQDLEATNPEPFDFFFIDADKGSNPLYFETALRLSRPGSLILVDNVVRDGKIIDAESDDALVIGVRRLNDMMARDPRVEATVIQTVGVKGYDGLAIAFVN